MKIFSLLLSIGIFLLLPACRNSEKSNTSADSIRIDTVMIRKNDTVQPKVKTTSHNVDSTIFSAGSIDLGSTAMIFREEAVLMADSNMLPCKEDTTLKRGDKVRIKSIHKNTHSKSIVGYIYKVELISSAESMCGYLHDFDLAFYFKDLADGRTLITGFAWPPFEQNGNQYIFNGELMILDKNGLVSSIRYPLSDSTAITNGEHSYFTPDIYVKPSNTQALGYPKLMVKIILGYGSCGYYTTELIFIESNGKLYLCTIQRTGGNGSMYYNYSLIWPDEKEGTPNTISVKYIQAYDDEAYVHQKDSSLVRYHWNDIKGVTSIDTVYNKITKRWDL